MFACLFKFIESNVEDLFSIFFLVLLFLHVPGASLCAAKRTIADEPIICLDKFVF